MLSDDLIIGEHSLAGFLDDGNGNTDLLNQSSKQDEKDQKQDGGNNT